MAANFPNVFLNIEVSSNWSESGPGVKAPEPTLPAMTAILCNLWGSNNSVPLKIDEAALVIGNSRRRHTVAIMADIDGPHDVGDLAETVASIELDKRISELTSMERKRVYIALTQHHLDKLADVDAISYDERKKRVYATGATEPMAELVKHFESVCARGGREK